MTVHILGMWCLVSSFRRGEDVLLQPEHIYENALTKRSRLRVYSYSSARLYSTKTKRWTTWELLKCEAKTSWSACYYLLISAKHKVQLRLLGMSVLQVFGYKLGLHNIVKKNFIFFAIFDTCSVLFIDRCTISYVHSSFRYFESLSSCNWTTPSYLFQLPHLVQPSATPPETSLDCSTFSFRYVTLTPLMERVRREQVDIIS